MQRNPAPPVHDDRTLVREIVSGSLEAWHGFIDAYTPLLFGVIRRYLSRFGDDEQRTLYVETLESLYAGKLADYRGDSRLSTWLFLFVRSRCLDALRSRNGRHRLPGRLHELTDLDREIYKLYYVWGCGVDEMRMRLAAGGTPIGIHELAERLERIDEHIDNRSRRRIAFELQARAIGCASGRLLDYVHNLRIELEHRAQTSSPEEDLLDRESKGMIDMVQGFIERLPDLEKNVIDLRYYHGFTARRTAERLGLGGERRVYTVEQRAIRHLRRMFES